MEVNWGWVCVCKLTNRPRLNSTFFLTFSLPFKAESYLRKVFNRPSTFPPPFTTYDVTRYRIKTDPDAGFHYFLLKVFVCIAFNLLCLYPISPKSVKELYTDKYFHIIMMRTHLLNTCQLVLNYGCIYHKMT